jgi:hypothetical protein
LGAITLEFDMSDLTSWGTFLSGLGTLILALVGIALVVYDLRLRGRQISESRARANSALEVELRTSIYYRARGASAQLEPVLETRVILKNISSEVWAVPLVYLQARAAPEPSADTQVKTFSEWDFNYLRECSHLSQPLNVARFPDTLFYIAPGECESVVRWDALTEIFIRDFPLIIVKLEVFSAPDRAMGASYSSSSGKKRARWLEFIDGENGARHRKVIVSVAPRDISGGPQKGGWSILKEDSDDIDEENSRNFHEVLAKMSKTGRQSLVALGDELSKRQGLSSFLGSSGIPGVATRVEGAPNQRPAADA